MEGRVLVSGLARDSLFPCSGALTTVPALPLHVSSARCIWSPLPCVCNFLPFPSAKGCPEHSGPEVGLRYGVAASLRSLDSAEGIL